MENEQTSADYQKGFNEGYLITKHLPELSDSLSNVKSEAPRIEGFQDGRKQYVLDQTKSMRPSWMKTDWGQEKHEDRAKDQDKEPER